MSAPDLGAIFDANRSHSMESNRQEPQEPHTPPDTSTLGYEQREVFEAIEKSSDNAFITGRAGTGKSYLLRFFVENSRKKVVVVAPTGVAAINVGGQTVHSFFRIPPHSPIQKSELQPSSGRLELYRNLDTIVVDEVSMVRADIMDAIDYIMQEANNNNCPFGGKQVLMFGDLYQLPPVTNPQERRYLDDKYGGAFFFHAPVIKDSDISVFELTHIFRQKDKVFIDILNGVREGSISIDRLSTLNERANASASNELAIVIAPYKETVERINASMLDSLESPLFSYRATVTGDFRETDFPTLKELKLKVGARVMMLRNDQGTSSDRPDENRRWVNGTLATVSRLTSNQIWVKIKGVEHQIDRVTWYKVQYSYRQKEKRLDKRVTAAFTQFPVVLAWAITVHKAQGATYASVGIDLAGGMFAEGQTYVALSRCVDMNRLYLSRPIVHQDIKVSNEVRAFIQGAKHDRAEASRITEIPKESMQISGNASDTAPMASAQQTPKVTRFLSDFQKKLFGMAKED